jgi:probable rRNA maturation factor
MPTKSKNAQAFSLSVQYASEAKYLPTRAQCRRWVKAALQQSAQITLRVVDEAEGLALNTQFRHKKYPTNVLTFVYDEGGLLSGDIVLCAPVVEAEAKAQKKTREAHYAHLTVHGVLHLQGYDHEKNRDAKIMETLEATLMHKLGYTNPYPDEQK